MFKKRELSRFRYVNNTYEFLITPFRVYDTGFEILLGNWEDETFEGFNVLYMRCNNSIEYKLPPIDWYALSNLGVEWYKYMKNVLLNVLSKYNLQCEFSSRLMNSSLLKNIFFERVKKYKSQFRLCNHMNDIILYKIIIDRKSLDKLLNLFESMEYLNLYKKKFNIGWIELIGRTDVYITYSIHIFYY